MKLKQTKFKEFAFQVKELSEDGTFTGYASVFNNLDFDEDKIVKGAFRTTIQKHKGKFPILWQHRIDIPVGVNDTASEDDYGLLCSGKLNLNSSQGKDAYGWMKFAYDNGLDVGLSIGYRVIKSHKEKDSQGKDTNVRVITEIQLYEYSIVTFPANEKAQVTGVKGEYMKDSILMQVFQEKSSIDFTTALQQAQQEDMLYRTRWTLSDALSDSLGSIIEDTTLTKDDKISKIGETYDQYGKAMTDWWGAYLNLQGEDDTSGDVETDGSKKPVDSKAGSKISADTAGKIMQAHGMISQGHACMKEGHKCMQKGMKMLYDMVGGTDESDGDKSDKIDPKENPNPDDTKHNKENESAKAADKEARALLETMRLTFHK